MLCNGLNIAESEAQWPLHQGSWGHANCRIFVVTGLLQGHFFYCFLSVALCNELNIAESEA